jgi:glucose-1-phosphate adenylyltransferase
MKDTIALLLAGGIGSRLNVLVWHCAKPAIPYGGGYRIIDFTMGNIKNSRIRNVGIIAQYQFPSLISYLKNGESWGFLNNHHCFKILLPSNKKNNSNKYSGTADAVAKNLDFVKQFNAQEILILAGDHIYNMDYRAMIAFHRERKADLTIAMKKVPWGDIRKYGIASIDGEQKVIHWQEKPLIARSNLASMGIYVFNVHFLEEILFRRNGHDFGYHIIRNACQKNRAYAYLFKGYWVDVGTLHAYWNSNLDSLNPKLRLNLINQARDRASAQEDIYANLTSPFISKNAYIKNSFISNGAVVEGTVARSIVYPGVHIKKNAKVIDSIIMHDSVIEQDTFLFQVIADQKTLIDQGAQIGIGECTSANKKYPEQVFTGLTLIGKQAYIPINTKIYRNTIVEPQANKESFARQKLEVGSYISR